MVPRDVAGRQYLRAGSILLACGGCDESLVSTRANADLGLRLYKMGVRFRFQPDALTYQIFAKSARDPARRGAYWYGRNEVFLCRKHPDCRPYSMLAAPQVGPWWKRRARELVARPAVSPEPLVRIPFWIAEQLRTRPSIRLAGIRLLGARQGIVALRGALAAAGSWQALRREFGLRLPVLLYHHVGPPRLGTHPALTLPPEQFGRQVRWLARAATSESGPATGWRDAGKVGRCRRNQCC